jgi:hypothetical protein
MSEGWPRQRMDAEYFTDRVMTGFTSMTGGSKYGQGEDVNEVVVG